MPLALPRRRALPDATLKSNKAGACSRFVKGKKKKKEKKVRRVERVPASREHVKVLPRSAGATEEKKERKAREGREEDEEDQEEKEREVSGEERGGRLNVGETKPKRRVGER